MGRWARVPGCANQPAVGCGPPSRCTPSQSFTLSNPSPSHPPTLLSSPLSLTRPSRLDARSVPQLPAGFAAYLQAAGLIAFLLPAGALLALAAGGHSSAGLLLFGGYLLAFVPQMLMEVKLFNREWSSGLSLELFFCGSVCGRMLMGVKLPQP